ncbi:uncharacterized protein LOC129874130 [Solanum dulcamara]|uniref:uncharacterized protein LOC129874130 n=1 Tax=Solanum dulcamara TaxID=45834 RepID=UPI00248660BF|nr:uncharacterized protein LOC129874130 [Solanum dulcamara]
MAIDVCCEIASLVVSPRISFSHDDGIPIECHQQQQQHHYRSDAFLLESSTIDFDFCVTDKQLFISSADELFSNGKILPFEFKKSTPFAEINPSLQKQPEKSLLENGKENTKKKSLKEFLSTDLDDDDEEQQETTKLPQAKPFWQFRRSSSLNYQNSQNSNVFLQFLARSNSTGSAPIQKNPKIYQKQSSQREQREKIKVLRKSSSLSSSSTSSSSSSSSFSTNFSSFNQSHPLHSSSSKKGQSHPLKKSYSRSYGNGVHVSPVLNIPHALFGLGSLFCNGKSKKKK